MSPSLTQMFFVRYPPCAEIPRYQRLTLLHRSSSRSRPDSVLNVPRRGRLGSPRTVGDFRQAGQEQRVFLPIVEFDNCGNKEVRIRRLGTYLQRKLRFKTRSPGTALRVQQLQDFPLGDHDDGPDALEQALRLPIDLGNGRHQPPLPQRLISENGWFRRSRRDSSATRPGTATVARDPLLRSSADAFALGFFWWK